MTRDIGLATMRRKHETPERAANRAIIVGIVTVALQTTYPKIGQSTASAAEAFRAAENDLTKSGLQPDDDGLFSREVALTHWPAERRRAQKSHFTRSRKTEPLQTYIAYVLEKPPMAWPDLRVEFDLDSEHSGQPSSAQKRMLSAAMRFAVIEAELRLQSGVVDQATYLQYQANISAWKRSRRGGSPLHGK